MPKKSEVLECKVKPGKKSRKVVYDDDSSSSDESYDNAIEIDDRETGASYEVEKIRRRRSGKNRLDNYYISNSNNNNVVIKDYLNSIYSNVNANNYSNYIKGDNFDLEALRTIDFSNPNIIIDGTQSNNVAIAQIPVDEFTKKRLMQTLDNYKSNGGKYDYIRILKILMSSMHYRIKKNTTTINLLKQTNVRHTKILLEVTKKIRLLEKMISNPQPMKLLEVDVRGKSEQFENVPTKNLIQAVSELNSNFSQNENLY